MEKTENYPPYVIEVRPLEPEVIVVGNQKELTDFSKMLEANGIAHYPAYKQKKGTTQSHEEGHEFHKDFMLSPLVKGLLIGVTVELTKEAVKAILKWLEKKRRKTRLRVKVEGNIDELSNKQREVLEGILRAFRKASKPKSTRTRRKKKRTKNARARQLKLDSCFRCLGNKVVDECRT